MSRLRLFDGQKNEEMQVLTRPVWLGFLLRNEEQALTAKVITTNTIAPFVSNNAGDERNYPIHTVD